ncbi:MAG TPA: zinc ribbon domain-containing protein [Pyrinomonadaceae bacterium]
MSSPEERLRCPVCRAVLAAGSPFCERCGARLDEARAREELSGVNYLLSELERWEAERLIASEEAAALRTRYESRREELRAQLAAGEWQASVDARPQLTDKDSTTNAAAAATRAPQANAETAAQNVVAKAPPVTVASVARPARSSFLSTILSRLTARPAKARTQVDERRAVRRPLFETLADPHTLRLLLYTGAAMLVVGIVIWLRDVLYLKLQEPLVQAVLLGLGTVAVLITGWLMTLRTSLRLTGRALTLIGALLVPVNFWFLVRSGLISNNGRAWMVCALCAVLYALTAALLRERLYVYMACAASIATAWALVYRASPEAYGLYSLTTTTASLIFLHLSRLFPNGPQASDRAEESDVKAEEARKDERRATASRMSYELWGPPLAGVALMGTALSATFYMLLRPGASPSFGSRTFVLHTSDYSAGLAMLLFAAGAYVAWFAARFIYTKRRSLLYTTSALALFWTLFLLLDGLQLEGRTHLLALSGVALLAAVCAARFVREKLLAESVYRASAMVLTLLLVIAGSIALIIHLDANTLETAWRLSIFFVLATTILFGVLKVERDGGRSLYGAWLGATAALMLLAAGLDALQAARLFPASWPVAAGVVCAAFVLERLSAGGPGRKTTGKLGELTLEAGVATPRVLVRTVTDGAVLACAVLWFVRTLPTVNEGGWSAVLVLLLSVLYWTLRASQQKQALYVYVGTAHAGALTWALVMALGLERRWAALVFTLALFPVLFAVGLYARGREWQWLARPVRVSAATVAALAGVAVVWEAAPVLEPGRELLLSPMMTAGALCVVTMAASMWTEGRERVHYFRGGLAAAVLAFVLAALRAGYAPLVDVEVYTSPIAVLLLIVAYVSVRREWDEYEADTSVLLWVGSLLLCGPLLMRALQFRLWSEVAAQWRDAVVLCVALGLLLFGVVGRLRAPVMIGMTTLVVELFAVAVTSVEWLQVPLKTYLITAGALSLVVWGIFEYRREQLLLMRERLHERGAVARERFRGWR